MIDDPLLKLAFSLEANHGVYALLLGSGISRDAGIPTGWDIVLDLIRRFAAMRGEDPGPDPDNWYRQTFGKIPKYDELMNYIAATQSERRNILRPYFEPTEDDLEQGRKAPTLAHQNIAALVKMGYIRMILTTNFDRLTEIALNNKGIFPDIINSEDQLNGAIPYVHSKCYLIKLHGDYIDTRIKNTPEELSTYSPKMNELLDRIFDEFGLIVCGWSSASDTALRDAIFRAPNRRFTTFWLSKGEMNEDAKRMVDHRKAESIAIESADQAFNEIKEKVESLSELHEANSMSTAVAVSTVKRYIVDPKHRIRLHELIREETERVYQELKSDRFETNGIKFTDELFQMRMHDYESLIKPLSSMLTALSFYDSGENAHLITSSLERLANKPRHNGIIGLNNLQLYPALLVFYSVGISALCSKKFDNLKAILLEPKYREFSDRENVPIVDKLHVYAVFDEGADKLVPRPDAKREYTPANNYIFDVIKPTICNYIPDDIKYMETFDIFEYILSLTCWDLLQRSWSPPGIFGWRYRRYYGSRELPTSEFINNGIKLGANWDLLKSGFFKGSVDHLSKVIEENDVWLEDVTRGWH